MSDTREQQDSRPPRQEGDSPEPRREGEERGPGPRRGKGFFKKKVCKFCAQKLRIDYKDQDVLRPAEGDGAGVAVLGQGAGDQLDGVAGHGAGRGA